MKKQMKYYLPMWMVAVGLYNVVHFAVPRLEGISDASFWTCYGCIMLSFLVMLGCGLFALTPDRIEQRFLRLPLVNISYGLVWVMLLVGVVCRAVPVLPLWGVMGLCAVVMAFNFISILKASAAAEIITDREAALAQKTSTIRKLTAEAQALLVTCQTEETRAAVQQVAEALRYSDPVSNSVLTQYEVDIARKLGELTNQVNANEVEKTQQTAADLCRFIAQRNTQCKLTK